MSVRELQREVTRERILAAVLDLVADGRADIAVPEVGRRSGVSLATIYRYFPTKDALLDAAAEEPSRQAAGLTTADVHDGPAHLRTVWRSFEHRLPLVRRQAASEAGRAMRMRRYPASRAWFSDRIADAGIDPESAEGARLVRLALLLTSSLAFLDLYDRQQRDADAAVDDVEWAINALQQATANELRGRS